ncbi:MAG: hypothetical protein QXP70_04790 [Methanomassiliicoccales archaeon]
MSDYCAAPGNLIKHEGMRLAVTPQELGRRLKFGGSIAMIVAGLAVYWGYGIAYGEWNPLSSGNEGVYSLMVFFIGLGAAGAVLFRRKSAA